MREILVPVDGSIVVNRAVRHTIEYVHRVKDATILLVNVQHTLERWYKHGLMNEEALKHLRQHSEDESAEARAILDQAGIPTNSRSCSGTRPRLLCAWPRSAIAKES